MTIRGMSGFGAAAVGPKRNVFGSARYIPGLANNPLKFDTGPNPQPATINTTTDIPITAAVTTGEPVVVVVMRCASASKGTTAGTLTVSLVHSDNTTTALSSTTTITGSSVNNFLCTFHTGLATSGDKAIRIVSATADASTAIVFRAGIWAKNVGNVATTGSSANGTHPPHTLGPYASSVLGGPVFIFSDSWSGSSASKGVTWNTPLAPPNLPGKLWLSQTFTITGGGSYPMIVNITNGGPAATYTVGGNSTDWIDETATAPTSNWGEIL